MIIENLTIYYHKVNENFCNKKFCKDFFPDYSHRCPICGAKDCAIFIGFYTRWVIDENGNIFENFPIARFLCKGKGKRKWMTKGKRKVSCKTFSLLPHKLIPYSKYSISFVINSVIMRVIDNISYDKILNNLADLSKERALNLCSQTICDFKHLILNSCEKLINSGMYTNDIKINFNTPDIDIRAKSFIEFAKDFVCNKNKSPIRGPCGLAYDFYLNSGGFYRNAQFLFGTPSQFRI